MKITKIIPDKRDRYQMYKVFFTEDFCDVVMIEREKKILQIFGIDKHEFKQILLASIEEEIV